MTRVFSKVFGPIDHESFAAEKINSVGHTFCIDVFAGALLEVFGLLEAQALLNATLVHFSRFLAKRRMLFVVWLKILFPDVLDKLWH